MEARSGRRRRWPRRLLFTLVGLALLFYVGGGWYFSDVLHDRALSGEERRASTQLDPDLTVQAVTDGAIVLRAIDDPPRSLETEGLFGLRWEGGHGTLGSITQIQGADVAREFTLIAGGPPLAGAPAQIDPRLYETPQEAGLEAEDVAIPGPLGQYPAWFTPGTSGTWVILVHGNSMSRTDVIRWAPSLSAAGYPTLIVTYRNDVGAPEDPSGLLRYGLTEWEDLEAAVRYALDEGAQEVVLHGTSMGGGIVQAFLERSDLADAVPAVFMDAPMLDFSETVDDNASREPLIGPIDVPPSLTWSAKTIARFRFGVDWSELDYLGDGLGDVPTLIVHGTKDLTVPIATSREAAEMFPRDVTLIECPGLDHIECWNLDPEAMEREMLRFLDQAVGSQG